MTDTVSIDFELKKYFDERAKQKLAATYRIELFFGTDKTNRSSFAGVLTVWRRSQTAPSDSFELISFCPVCGIPILPEAIGLSVTEGPDGPVEALTGTCHECGNTFPAEKLHQAFIVKDTVKGWAVTVSKFWNKLGGDVELLLKRHRVDLKPIYANFRENPSHPDINRTMFSQAYDFEMALYPLERMIDDSATAGIEAAIRSFLAA